MISTLTRTNIIDNKPVFNFFEIGNYIARKQAKISFKAGFNEGVSKAMDAAESTYGAQIDNAKQEGRRVAVECVDYELWENRSPLEAWQEFKKELGVE